MTVSMRETLAGRRFEVVVIGASAGGIRALMAVLPALPARFGFAVVAVLHLPDQGESRLADVFSQHVAAPVLEAQDKMPLLPGKVYFAPGGYHLSVEAERIFSLSREEPVHFSRPAIDLLMTSVADACGRGALGILLTGASADGAAGLACVGRAGGVTVAQDPLEAEIATMPRAAIALRAPDLVLTLAQIHELITLLETL
jgi:two-component system chemotaxis response regulator CheB